MKTVKELSGSRCRPQHWNTLSDALKKLASVHNSILFVFFCIDTVLPDLVLQICSDTVTRPNQIVLYHREYNCAKMYMYLILAPKVISECRKTRCEIREQTRCPERTVYPASFTI